MADVKTLKDIVLPNGQKISPEILNCLQSEWPDSSKELALERLRNPRFAAEQDALKETFDGIQQILKKKEGPSLAEVSGITFDPDVHDMLGRILGGKEISKEILNEAITDKDHKVFKELLDEVTKRSESIGLVRDISNGICKALPDSQSPPKEDSNIVYSSNLSDLKSGADSGLPKNTSDLGIQASGIFTRRW